MKLNISVHKSTGDYEQDKTKIADNWKTKEFDINNENEAREVFCYYHFSPHEWGKGYRNSRNFIKSHFICADVDEGLTIDQVKERFKQFQYIIVTSKNHQKVKNDKPACERFHLILPITKPIEDPEQIAKLKYARLFDGFDTFSSLIPDRHWQTFGVFFYRY